MSQPLIIDYYTDILCIWAWIAQKRIDELEKSLGDKIIIHHRYIDIFGNTQEKMQKQWQEKGGYQGFAQHVVNSVKAYEHASINQKIWTEVRPTTSANAHLVIKAIEHCYNKETAANLACTIRQAFFIDAKDISKLSTLYDIVQQNSLDENLIRHAVNTGEAMAMLMSDYQSAKQQLLRGSPSYIINEGRQTLYGNVGYRVLQANIEEVLNKPQNTASWC